jgi:PAS domain S-box-containing protein
MQSRFPLATAGRIPILGYGVAIVSVAVAVICTLQMQVHWQASAPVSLLLMAVILTTGLGGVRPAFLATALSLLGFAWLALFAGSASLPSEWMQAVQLLSLSLVAGYVVWRTALEHTGLESLRQAHDELQRNHAALRRENLERRRGEELLRASEEKFHALAESAPGAIFIYREGCICYANPAASAITGYSATELWNTETLQSIAPTLRDLLCGRGLEPESGAQSGPSHHEVRIVTKAGEERWLDFTGAVFEFGGQPAVVGVACDITQRKRMEERLLAVQEEERRHLSRELHDEFGQLLASVTLQLRLASSRLGETVRPSLDASISLLQRAADELRSLVLELRPTMLESAGLLSALEWLAEQHQQRSGVVTKVVGQVDEVSSDLAIACFRVVQEALTNVVRHARARHVSIELQARDGRLELEVRDDGAGFDVGRTLERAVARGSVGLRGMKERVQILGGDLQVDSSPGSGTRIRVSIPVTLPGITSEGDNTG